MMVNNLQRQLAALPADRQKEAIANMASQLPILQEPTRALGLNRGSNLDFYLARLIGVTPQATVDVDLTNV